LLVVALTNWRLFYGVDFTDEAYYVEIPYRFVLGARPFIDETTPSQQGAAMLAYPIFAAYHAIAGVAGVILFARELHLLFSCFVGACVFVGLRPYARNQRGSPSFIDPIAFVPFNLHDLSYNNLASGFVTAGCFLGLRCLATKQLSSAAAAGLAHGLGIFVYPTLIAPALAYALIFLRLSAPPRRHVLVAYASAALLPVAVLAAVVAHRGFSISRTSPQTPMNLGTRVAVSARRWRSSSASSSTRLA
jgi:hypothetical protein